MSSLLARVKRLGETGGFCWSLGAMIVADFSARLLIKDGPLKLVRALLVTTYLMDYGITMVQVTLVSLGSQQVLLEGLISPPRRASFPGGKLQPRWFLYPYLLQMRKVCSLYYALFDT